MIVFFFITIILSALFSGIEIAYVTSDKLHLQVQAKKNKWYSFIYKIFLNDPKKFIITTVTANNIILVIYGIVASEILEKEISKVINNIFLIFLIQTIITTSIILILGEYLPKNIFRLKANFFLKIFIVPVFFVYVVLSPIIFFFIFISNIIINKLGKGIKKGVIKEFNKLDLYEIVEEENRINKQEYEYNIFKKALRFNEIKIKECMIPRNEIVSIEISTPINEAITIFKKTGFSKLPVYKNNIDNIIGYVHVGDIFYNPTSIEQILRDIIIVPETYTAHKLLQQFTQSKKSIALVVDEYGGTSGIVTMEDILEEIFGEIVDEYDTVELIERKIGINEYIFSGRLEIDYVNEKYKLNIPTSHEYETIAGFILYHYNGFPPLNKEIAIKDFIVKVLKASKTKIELVNIKILQHADIIEDKNNE
ncbi:MAG: hemolysin family protein [Bacteroidales bacterium]|nr:hemolysin family protein [Bacteroidales bacterium]